MTDKGALNLFVKTKMPATDKQTRLYISEEQLHLKLLLLRKMRLLYFQQDLVSTIYQLGYITRDGHSYPRSEEFTTRCPLLQ